MSGPNGRVSQTDAGVVRTVIRRQHDQRVDRLEIVVAGQRQYQGRAGRGANDHQPLPESAADCERLGTVGKPVFRAYLDERIPAQAVTAKACLEQVRAERLGHHGGHRCNLLAGGREAVQIDDGVIVLLAGFAVPGRYAFRCRRSGRTRRRHAPLRRQAPPRAPLPVRDSREIRRRASAVSTTRRRAPAGSA